MISSSSTADLFNATVRDRTGAKIGTVGQVYVDPDDAAPTWASVKTGLFGTHESFVPLHDAEWRQPDLVVPYDRDVVKDAPRVDVDATLTEDETDRLYEYYSLGTAGSADTGTTRSGTTTESGSVSAGSVSTTTSAGPTGTSGTTGDDVVLTRSEEQLHVGTQRVVKSRMRLQKFTVTEMKTITVPVTHEEVRLVEVPVGEHELSDGSQNPETDADRASGRHRSDATEPDTEPREMILTEERVVVTTERVPVERVRLATDVVTEQQEVTEDLRREHIELTQEPSGSSPERPAPTVGADDPATPTGRPS